VQHKTWLCQPSGSLPRCHHEVGTNTRSPWNTQTAVTYYELSRRVALWDTGCDPQQLPKLQRLHDLIRSRSLSFQDLNLVNRKEKPFCSFFIFYKYFFRKTESRVYSTNLS
jgi:hypothetical protein